MYSSKQVDITHHEKIFQANDIVCSQIINRFNRENLITKKLVHHLNLPNKPHSNLHLIEWIEKGLYIQPTQICKVSFSIETCHKSKVICDLVLLDGCHILLTDCGKLMRMTYIKIERIPANLS